jgi:hypothetical protein
VPAVIVNEELVSTVRAPSAAWSVYVPAVSTLQPANVATLATAALLSPPVHASVPPAGVVRESVTVLVFPETVFPNVSWTVTAGWVAKATLAAAVALGCVVIVTWAAAPALTTVFGVLTSVARERVLSVAVSV